LDFGTVTVGDSLDKTFSISNTGGGTLSGTVSETCDHYSLVGDATYSLGSGGSKDFTVRFKPTSVGVKNCTVETGNGACVDVSCTGTGEEAPPVCVVDPTSLDFGTVTVGDSLDKTFNISNTGGGTLSGTVSETCDDYTLVGDVSYSLGSGQSKDFTVRFEPLSGGVKDCTIETGSGACVDVSCTGMGMPPGLVFVYLDIKPRSCPNAFSTKSRLLPVAILGTEAFDVTTVDLSTVQLEGVPPLKARFADVSMPMEPDGEPCECDTLAPDGSTDLVLKFDAEAIVAALEPVYDGETRVLTITGMTDVGTAIQGEDCVVIRHKGRAKPSDQMASGFSLGDNRPNPFNPETELSYVLPRDCHVNLTIYNVLGKRIRVLVDGHRTTGQHYVLWDGKDAAGRDVGSGIYFYRIKAEQFAETKKMILMR
jgi:hypothetical protein